MKEGLNLEVAVFNLKAFYRVAAKQFPEYAAMNVNLHTVVELLQREAHFLHTVQPYVKAEVATTPNTPHPALRGDPVFGCGEDSGSEPENKGGATGAVEGTLLWSLAHWLSHEGTWSQLLGSVETRIVTNAAYQKADIVQIHSTWVNEQKDLGRNFRDGPHDEMFELLRDELGFVVCSDHDEVYVPNKAVTMHMARGIVCPDLSSVSEWWEDRDPEVAPEQDPAYVLALWLADTRTWDSPVAPLHQCSDANRIEVLQSIGHWTDLQNAHGRSYSKFPCAEVLHTLYDLYGFDSPIAGHKLAKIRVPLKKKVQDVAVRVINQFHAERFQSGGHKLCKTELGANCRGCPDCAPVMGDATYKASFGGADEATYNDLKDQSRNVLTSKLRR